MTKVCRPVGRKTTSLGTIGGKVIGESARQATAFARADGRRHGSPKVCRPVGRKTTSLGTIGGKVIGESERQATGVCTGGWPATRVVLEARLRHDEGMPAG